MWFQSKRNGFADEKVLWELLAFHSATVGSGDAETRVQQTRNRLEKIDNSRKMRWIYNSRQLITCIEFNLQ